jgi:CO/xanthine dehydrogenase FAD-binding subunit
LREVEARLRGTRIERDAIREGAALPLDLIQSRSRVTYRREVMRGFVARSLVNAAHQAGADVTGVLQQLEAIYA